MKTVTILLSAYNGVPFLPAGHVLEDQCISSPCEVTYVLLELRNILRWQRPLLQVLC